MAEWRRTSLQNWVRGVRFPFPPLPGKKEHDYETEDERGVGDAAICTPTSTWKGCDAEGADEGSPTREANGGGWTNKGVFGNGIRRGAGIHDPATEDGVGEGCAEWERTYFVDDDGEEDIQTLRILCSDEGLDPKTVTSGIGF